MSKLTIAQRRAIIAAPQAHRICQRLANEYGISRKYVQALRAGGAASFEVRAGGNGHVRPHVMTTTSKRLGEGRSPYCPECGERYRFELNALIGQTIEVCRCRSTMITPEVARLQWVPQPVRGLAALAVAVLVLAQVACYPLPTEPKASASKVHNGGVPGITDIMVPCWADSSTAWIVNLPLCTAVGGAR